MALYNVFGNELSVDVKKQISILFVGNSLTQDGIAYLPYMLKEYHPEIDFKFYMWYNGGYTLAQQYTKFQNDSTCEIFSVAENSKSWTNSNNSVCRSISITSRPIRLLTWLTGITAETTLRPIIRAGTRLNLSAFSTLRSEAMLQAFLR